LFFARMSTSRHVSKRGRWCKKQDLTPLYDLGRLTGGTMPLARYAVTSLP
jgi:hypothetical protein